jgi:hypothetical protein
MICPMLVEVVIGSGGVKGSTYTILLPINIILLVVKWFASTLSSMFDFATHHRRHSLSNTKTCESVLDAVTGAIHVAL